MKKDNAFTGLEAAIVLIAFVVVAAVFSYVLLGAGFFATQKAQEVTYAGIQQTTSNMYLVGQVYGNMSTGLGVEKFLGTINLKLGVPEAGQPQDAYEMQLLFSNDKGIPTVLNPNKAFGDTDPGYWNVTNINGDPRPEETTAKLYPGDKADIEIILNTDAFMITSGKPNESIGESRSFTIEMRPRIGAAYLISKTLSTGFRNGPLY